MTNSETPAVAQAETTLAADAKTLEAAVAAAITPKASDIAAVIDQWARANNTIAQNVSAWNAIQTAKSDLVARLLALG
jgi:hypothetical protein